MTKIVEALHVTATKWRSGNQDHRDGVLLAWETEVYGWKN